MPIMARFSEIAIWHSDAIPTNSLPCVVHGLTLYVAFDTALDVAQAKQLLQQKHETVAKEAQHLEKKLQNDAYKNAKPEQWQEDHDLFGVKEKIAEKLVSFLNLLG